MNTSELKAERIRQSKNTKYMAKVIGKSDDAYLKKERGTVKFDATEMIAIQNDLQLSLALFNAIFFDSRLLFSKFSHAQSPEL